MQRHRPIRLQNPSRPQRPLQRLLLPKPPLKLTPGAKEENRALARFFFEPPTGPVSAVIGVDEVGRGSLFGPVTVGAALLTCENWLRLQDQDWIAGVTDSKLVSKKRREELAPLIEHNMPAATAHISVRYIDTYNINAAIRYGIYRAVQALMRKTGFKPAELRIIADGNYRFEYPALGMQRPMPRLDTEIKADLKYFPVSAASIVAKVRRDAMITRAAERFPGYGLEQHAGYGTAAHRAAISQLGETPFHRTSFRGQRG